MYMGIQIGERKSQLWSQTPLSITYISYTCIIVKSQIKSLRPSGAYMRQ